MAEMTAQTSPRIEPGPDLRGREPSATKPKTWRVIHACEYARDVLPLVEGQVTAGMRPYIVTPHGAGAAELYLREKNLEQPVTLSLLRAWQDVRNWRKSLLECDPENSADVVHAHSFASGMAAVRNFSCVVYDPDACIEELAIATGQCDRGSWMARSFRVAEQFILSRAEAVIVHSSAMKAAVEERGAPAGSIFVIPEPLDVEALEAEVSALTSHSLQERLGTGHETVTYFLPQWSVPEADKIPDSVLSVLEAFAFDAGDVANSVLLIESNGSTDVIRSHAQRLGIADRLFIIDKNDLSAALQLADLVISTGDAAPDLIGAQHAEQTFLASMWLGKPVLAADVPRNRDCTPDGRGCLWFKEGDVKDLSHRLAFLGGNPDFRASLASSGRAFVQETRSTAAVGRQYDEAYRHALSRKKTGRSGQNNLPSLQPIASAGW
jgi:glycosyltransferase involved in cell wall biosynthesis